MKAGAEKISRWDDLIRTGQADLVVSELGKLVLKNIPRHSILPLAKICRRVGLNRRGLKLLTSLRSEEPQVELKSEFCSEYGLSLARNGSVDEALDLLQAIDNPSLEVGMHMGLVHLMRWEYREAIPHFLRHLNSQSDEYLQLVAMVNLASCYVYLANLEEARDILNQSIQLAQKLKGRRLLANCLEMLAQVEFQNGNFSLSRTLLDESISFTKGGDTAGHFFVFKWKSIIDGIEARNPEPIIRFRNRALKEEKWESLREADYYLLKINFSRELFDRLFFGTPFRSYQDRVCREFLATPSCDYRVGSVSDEANILELSTGKLKHGNDLVLGGKTHNLIMCLFNDLYAPRNMGALFHSIYPDEKFCIFNSPHRVWQIAFRARNWILKNQLQCQIVSEKGWFFFKMSEAFAVNLKSDRKQVDASERILQQAQDYFRTKEFSLSELKEFLVQSKSHTHRFVHKWLSEGLIAREGSGHYTLYSFVKPIKIPA